VSAVSTPPFRILGPKVPERPVIVSVPHAGRHYPSALLAAARVSRAVLERLEDRHADRLADAAVAQGFTVIVADMARAYIDLNRDESEWDAQMLSDAIPLGSVNGRVRAGLGIVPNRLHPVGDLWRQRIGRDELERRLEAVHRPWHRSVAMLLEAARSRFGIALLIDLHSMPRQPGGTPQFVIGDRHGQTASSELVDRLLGIAEGHGLSIARNAPYAGAHGIARHGRRSSAIEALQLEFDRSLYIAGDGNTDCANTASLAQLVARIAKAAEDVITGADDIPMAAE
jgi:N-formylglutamate amidohydrolase